MGDHNNDNMTEVVRNGADLETKSISSSFSRELDSKCAGSVETLKEPLDGRKFPGQEILELTADCAQIEGSGPQYKRGRGRSFFRDAPRKGTMCQGRHA